LEAAPGEEGSEFGEVAIDIISGEVPEFELSDAWRIADPASHGEVHEPCSAGGMSAFVSPAADIGGCESESGVDGIEEGGLADAALSADGGLSIGEELSELWDSLSGADAGGYDDAAGASEGAEVWEECLEVDEVNFANADDGEDTAFFGADEVAIDELGSEFRVSGGGDDEYLVDIGDEDVFAAVAAA
jgi:hypothetical protein